MSTNPSYAGPIDGQPEHPPPPQPNCPGNHGHTISRPTRVECRHDPVACTCRHCFAEITTQTSHKAGLYSWLLCLLICLAGCDLGCCCIPFCVNCSRDIVHTCPNCGKRIGVHKRL
ncbi:hypothetical protein EGW08_011394 [Elysia chlorotica]|uniref:LITAF domain-containing protein n=1 Tax=Elysia chlorotica TaxID=188477 RepID=A0A433TH29_ELYCH|nr:hypothetical protein EGW08_011394 [Elysia chlorotica]